MTFECPHCAARLQTLSPACPSCGRDPSSADATPRRVSVAAFVLLVAAGLILGWALLMAVGEPLVDLDRRGLAVSMGVVVGLLGAGAAAMAFRGQRGRLGALALGCAISGVIAAAALHGGVTRPPTPSRNPETPPEQQAAPPAFRAPSKSVDLTAGLGKARSAVRRILGQPASSTADVDNFAFEGFEVSIAYERKTAVRAIVSAPGAGRSIPGALAWLKLGGGPGGGRPIVVADRTYNVEPLADDTIVITESSYAQAEKQRIEAEAKKVARKQLAEVLEQAFLKGGTDARVRVRGKDDATLWIEIVFCDRAWLYNFVNESSAGKPAYAGLREAGFKRVECSDGFHQGASTDL
jgi:hypothetical protein